MIPEQRNPDWNWIKRDKQSILKTSRFASPTFHRWRPILLFLSLFFAFFLFFLFFRRRWREGRPPLFMGTSDSSWSPCLPFAIGSTKTNDRSSLLPCFTSAPAISVVSLFIVDARYNSDSESPDESTTLSVRGYIRVYIYVYLQDWRSMVRSLTTIVLAIVWITWGGPCVYATRFYTYRLWRLPLGPIHGLGIREIRTQLANCCPRTRRWNSIERNAITVFLPGREGMEASGDPISEILVHVSIHDVLLRNICHSAVNFSMSRITKSWQGTIIYRRKIAKWILNFELAFKLDERGFVGKIYIYKKKLFYT